MKKQLALIFILLSLLPTVLFGADSTSFSPGAVAAQTVSGVPIGGVIAWRSWTPPAGWIECNGQSTAAYPELAAVVGSTVPDLRGEFVRGWSHGRPGVDTGRSMGSAQGDMLKKHSGTTDVGGDHSHTGATTNTAGEHKHRTDHATLGVNNGGTYIAFPGSGTGSAHYSGYRWSYAAGAHSHTVTVPSTGSAHSHSFSVGATTDIETRSRNVALMYIIRAE